MGSVDWVCAVAPRVFLLSVFALGGCREQQFYCEQVGHVIGPVVQSKDAPRRCYELERLCQPAATCFEQPGAVCFRTYASDSYIYVCAPSARECDTLRQQRADAGIHVESCQPKRPQDVK
jgi:hypothetical protein